MTQLVKNINDMKDHAAIAFVDNFEVLQPFVTDAEAWIKRRYLGAGLFAKLAETKTDQDSSSSVSASGSESVDADLLVYEQLLVLSQGIVTNMALLNYIPEGQLEISDQGIRINTTDTKKTAFDWQIKKLEQRYKLAYHQKLEDMLDILFKEEVAEWDQSPVKKKLRGHFINSAFDFEKYFRIDESHLLFLDMLPDMHYVESVIIKALLGDSFMDELQERILDGEDAAAINPTDTQKAYLKLFSLLAAAVAYLTIKHTSAELPMAKPEDIDKRANHAQQQLQEYLDANASITLFTKYFESDKYTAPADATIRQQSIGVDNTDLNGLYAAF